MHGSASTLISSLVTSIWVLALSRFFTALGIAFVFAPGYVLISRFFGKEAQGRAAGLFGSFALVGNVIALLVDAVLPVYLGWRTTLLTNGVLELALAFSMLLAFRGKSFDRKDDPWHPGWESGKSDPFY